MNRPTRPEDVSIHTYWDEECGEWVAEAIGLPGCIGCGDTHDEAHSVCRRFIPEWLALARERGEDEDE